MLLVRVETTRNRFRRIVTALDQWRPTLIALTFDARWRERTVIGRPTLWTDQASAETLDQHGTRYRQMYDSSDGVVSVSQHAIERLRLCAIARVPVQERPTIARQLPLEFIEPLEENPQCHVVRDQFAPIVVAPNFTCEGIVPCHQLPEEIPSRDMDESQRRSNTRRLGSLTGPLRPDEYNVTPSCHTSPYRMKPS